MKASDYPIRAGAAFENVGRGNGKGGTPTAIERVVVGDEHAQRVVSAGEVQHDQRARCLPLRFGEPAEEGGRHEAIGEGRHSALHELASGNFHGYLYMNWYCGAARMTCARPDALVSNWASEPVQVLDVRKLRRSL